MKKLLLTAAAILATLNMYGQGQGVVSYNTTGATTDKRVWVNTTGQVGDGTLAAGSGYQTALYWAPSGTTDPSAFVQAGASTGFLNRAPDGTAGAAGTFFGGGRTISYSHTSGNGAVLAFQSRAWCVLPGETTFETATQRGSGPIFELKTKDPLNPLETTPAVGGAAGWRGYSIIVPEPSAIALGLLGAGALLMLRRRK